MTAEELLQHYAAGGRNFSGIVISELREGLFRGIDLSDINLEGCTCIFVRCNFRNTIWNQADLF